MYSVPRPLACSSFRLDHGVTATFSGERRELVGARGLIGGFIFPFKIPFLMGSRLELLRVSPPSNGMLCFFWGRGGDCSCVQALVVY